MSDRPDNLPAPPSSTPQAEGHWRAFEGILQELRRPDRLRSGEKALTRLRAEAEAADPSQADVRTSHPFVRELMRRYVAGTLDPIEVEALQVLLRCDPSQPEFQRLFKELSKAAPADTAKTITPVRPSSKRRKTVAPEPGKILVLHHRAWAVAAACALVLTAGLIWIAFSPRPEPRQANVRQDELRRRSEVLRRIAELDRQTRELAAAQLELPKPLPPKPAEPPVPPEMEQTPAPALPPVEDELAQRKEEAGKCARLLELQREFLQQELAGIQASKPSSGSDVDDTVAASNAATPAPRQPVEVGHVLTVDGASVSAVLIRAMEGTSQRQELTRGIKLMNGDRIEIERGSKESCASLEFSGGARIDLAERTTIQIVDRNAVRLEAGQIYACVGPQAAQDPRAEYAAPFSFQTPAANCVVEEARVEIHFTPSVSLEARTTARVDSGQVHLLNRKGHVLGRKGQELTAGANSTPGRSDGFQAPIWRGRSLTNPGLPYGKSNPVLVSDEDADRSFSTEYALALAHSGELDLRGLQISHGAVDARGVENGDTAALCRFVAREIAQLRKTGLRFAPEPVPGADRALQRPASGRCEETVPERNKAVDQLLIEARKASPDLPLVVVASGCLTDLASAWLLDRGISTRVIVATRTAPAAWNMDPWAATVVLENFRCVICDVGFPGSTLSVKRFDATRWDFLAARVTHGNTDFSQFATVTVPGFVQRTQRARFVRGDTGNPSDFRFLPDPNGKVWLTTSTDARLMAGEFEATFMNAERSVAPAGATRP